MSTERIKPAGGGTACGGAADWGGQAPVKSNGGFYPNELTKNINRKILQVGKQKSDMHLTNRKMSSRYTAC